jgi:hypothetical protein
VAGASVALKFRGNLGHYRNQLAVYRGQHRLAAMNFSPLRTWMNCLAVIVGLSLAGSVAVAQGLGSTPAPTTKNLLVNGSFENGTDGWTLKAYANQGRMAIDETEKHGGKPTLRVDNPAGDDTHLKQTVTVEPDTHYRLEGYIKTKDLQSVKRDGKGGAQLVLDNSWTRSPVISKTKSWTKVSVDIVTGAETTIDVGGRLGYDNVTGTAWFAELSLVKVGKAPPRR